MAKQFHRFIIYLGCLLFLLSFTSCGGKYEEDDIVYNNDFFTKELYQEITEIHITVSSIDYHITDRDVIFNVYKELASLPLEEYDQPRNTGLLGFTSFELVTGDQTIQLLFAGGDYFEISCNSFTKESKIEVEVVERTLVCLANWIEKNRF